MKNTATGSLIFDIFVELITNRRTGEWKRNILIQLADLKGNNKDLFYWAWIMLWAERTPEVMDHVEVADLGEKPSHSFSVVLAVSYGSGPARNNNFNINTQKNQRLPGPSNTHRHHLWSDGFSLPELAQFRPIKRCDTVSYTRADRTNRQVRVSKRLLWR